MAIEISDLKIVISGGAANVNPDLSLGGLRSTDSAGVVVSQTTAALTNVLGVVIDNAYGNALGDGVLKWDNGVSELSWQPFGAASAIATVLPDTGATPTVYVLGGANGYLIVTVIYSDLVAAVVQDTDITVNNKINNVFDSVSAQESTDGLIEYRCLYIQNTHSTEAAFDVRIWVKQQPTGPDEIDLSISTAVDPATADGDAHGPLLDEEDSTDVLDTAIAANELTAWARPTSQATGLLLHNIGAGQCVYFWQRRTVFAETTQQESNDNSKLGISALI